MQLSSDDPIYPVNYRGLSCFPLTLMSSGVKVMQGHAERCGDSFFIFLL